MTLLVLGNGADDAADALGDAVLAVDTASVGATGIDVARTEASCVAGAPSDVVKWALRELEATVVLVVGHPPTGLPDLPPASAVICLDRADAIRALRAWCTGSEDMEFLTTGTASALRLLRQRLRRRTASAHVTERAPRVSVLMTAHNHAAYLDATMQSVLGQTFEDFEVVVLDDGSSDASLSVLRRYETDRRVTVLSQENIGWTGRIDLVRNRLGRVARGELLAWHDSDDVSLPHRLAAQVEAFDQDPGIDICHGAAEAIDPGGRQLGLVWQLVRAYDDSSALRDMLPSNLVGNSSVMMRAEAFRRVGMWEEGYACDYHFWLKSADTLRFRYLPRRLVKYRLHGESLSTSAAGSQRVDREARRIRALILRRRTLQQLFPELSQEKDRQVWYEAGLTLGNSLVATDPAAALIAYGLAAETHRGPDVQHNRAVAHALLGDLTAAVAAAETANRDDPQTVALVSQLRRWDGSQRLTIKTPGSRLAAALATGKAECAAEVRRWDGTTLSTARAYLGVILGPLTRAVTHLALAEWARMTRVDTPVQWVIPDLGSGVEAVLAEVAAAASGLDLTAAADLLLEHVDDLRLLPPEVNRPTGVLTGPGDVEVLRQWLASVGSVTVPSAA